VVSQFVPLVGSLRPTMRTREFTPAFRELRFYRKQTVHPCFIYSGVIEFLLAANALKLPSSHLVSQLPRFIKGDDPVRDRAVPREM
jgi:hypothetical protein